MIFPTDSSILAAEAAYKEASKRVTEIGLEVEKTCPHTIWCGRDWRSSEYGGASFDAIYICVNCRMEVHVRYASYTSHEKAPEGSLVLRPEQLGIKDVFDLRVQGNNRKHLFKPYSTLGGWPNREEGEAAAREILDSD